jgi:hypothetical protein
MFKNLIKYCKPPIILFGETVVFVLKCLMITFFVGFISKLFSFPVCYVLMSSGSNINTKTGCRLNCELKENDCVCPNNIGLPVCVGYYVDTIYGFAALSVFVILFMIIYLLIIILLSKFRKSSHAQ